MPMTDTPQRGCLSITRCNANDCVQLPTPQQKKGLLRFFVDEELNLFICSCKVKKQKEELHSPSLLFNLNLNYEKI